MAPMDPAKTVDAETYERSQWSRKWSQTGGCHRQRRAAEGYAAAPERAAGGTNGHGEVLRATGVV